MDLLHLNVSHMMDLAPTYDQKEDDPKDGHSVLYKFRTAQIPFMEQQQRQADGRMLYFVACNPFRDSWANDDESAPDHSLAIVKEAWEHEGASGIKVYPPSGYAPAGNKIPGRPWSISPEPGRQWRARYFPDRRPPVTGAELDARLLKLCLWAARNDIPILAHCGQGEFEARNGYHKFANPEGWRKLIEDNRALHPELVNLRLCLAHAGGGGEWYNSQDATLWPKSDWGRTVYEMCRDYKNVNCDFACHDDIADPAKRQAFSRHIAQLIAASRANGAFDF